MTCDDVFVQGIREMVQIGGALLALLADWLARRDVTRLIFFANTRATTFRQLAEAIGFKPEDAFGLTLFTQPVSPASATF